MKQIKLTGKRGIGKFSIIDDEDFEKLNKYKWYVGKVGYAVRTKNIGKINGKRKNESIFIHRILLSNSIKGSIDHINHNKLDNRKNNLRLCTQQENTFNSEKSKSNTSGYKGVFLMKSGTRLKRWMAQLMFNRKSIFLGYFLTKEQAAKSYNNGAIKYFGEFARLNII